MNNEITIVCDSEEVLRKRAESIFNEMIIRKYGRAGFTYQTATIWGRIKDQGIAHVLSELVFEKYENELKKNQSDK